AAGELCQVARTLLRAQRFRRFLPRELALADVRAYLRALCRWEASLAGASMPSDDLIATRLAAWSALIARTQRRPLMLHLLGAFFRDTPTDGVTAARLLARLVEEQLAHALSRVPAESRSRRWMLAGLCRAARLPWADGRPDDAVESRRLLDALN